MRQVPKIATADAEGVTRERGCDGGEVSQMRNGWEIPCGLIDTSLITV